MPGASLLPHVRAKARVRVILEIEVEDAWGEDCPIGQLHRQAVEEAKEALRAGVRLDGIASNKTSSNARATVVGTLEVMSIITRKE